MNGPPLSKQARIRLERIFPPESRAEAERQLIERCSSHLPDDSDRVLSHVDRMRFAAMKTSGGTFRYLEAAVELGNRDFRDLLVSAGFGFSAPSSLLWMPDETR